MPDAVITVENLSKCYLVGHRAGEQARYNHTLRDAIAREARNFARKASDVFRGQLQECELRVQKGEVVGIIGPTAAGKEHTSQDLEPHHETDRGTGCAAGARRKSA